MAKIVRNCPQLSKTVQNIQKLSKYESDSTDENKNYQGCGIFIGLHFDCEKAHTEAPSYCKLNSFETKDKNCID